MAFGRYVFGTLGNDANIIIRYYLVPSRLSSDPKIYDLDGLFGVKFCFIFVMKFKICSLPYTESAVISILGIDTGNI